MKEKKLGSVFYFSISVVLIFVLWGFFLPHNMATTMENALNFITQSFGWFYLLATITFVIFIIYLGFGPYKSIKLGSDDDEPEYRFFTWLAMLFSAGMGIGLVFWGVAEPLSHYLLPPEGVTPETIDAARIALRYSFFHWGIHPWAIYAVIGLALAYHGFRKGEPGLISVTFRPLIGDKVDGPIGKSIDGLAVIATVFGVATSLGLGALQINGGLAHLTNIPNTFTIQIIIIAVVTVLYLTSATTGINKGIRFLSNINLTVAGILLLFVLIAGPTIFIIDNFTATIGRYIGNFISMSFRLTPFVESDWVSSWTLFYWAWWIAWAPFVGTFIARISKGRTIKEFVSGVLFVPAILAMLWFAAFGGSGLYLEMFAGAPIAQAVSQDVTSALFITLEQFPLAPLIIVTAIILITTFFITSADSATFVLGMLSTQGALNPRNSVKIVWGLLQSAIAVVLLLSGGLEGLQTASIIAALPFALIMLGICLALHIELKKELNQKKRAEKDRRQKIEKMLERYMSDQE